MLADLVRRSHGGPLSPYGKPRCDRVRGRGRRPRLFFPRL